MTILGPGLTSRAPASPLARFRTLEQRPLPFLLETVGPAGGRTLMGADPCALLVVRRGAGQIWRAGRSEPVDLPPLEALRRLMAEYGATEADRRAVRIVGYLGYDLAWAIETLPPQRAAGDQGFPDLLLGVYDRTFEWDAVRGSWRALEAKARRPRALSARDEARSFVSPPPAAGRNFTRAAYLEALRQIGRHIEAGDIYQANLSQRFAARWDGAPLRLYERLRDASPAPFAAYLRFGNHAAISSSPELFLEVKGRRVRTRPIKGTRPRGRTPAEDERLAGELLASGKDAAELTMIVDLERNDLGRVCRPGSVQVTALRELEAHPTVWHLSATVEGELAPGRDAADLLGACFPGGSITGAPKLRAIEILDRLEPTRRSVFTGSILCLTPAGEMVSSIAIRTLLWHGGRVTFQAGGGVVADSDPEAEYEETLVKARAMAAALGLEVR